jgi:hypothetical protein
MIHEKNLKPKISGHCPFDRLHAVALPPSAISADMSYLPYLSLILYSLVLPGRACNCKLRDRGGGNHAIS